MLVIFIKLTDFDSKMDPEETISRNQSSNVE